MSTNGPLPAILGPPKEPPRKCSVLEPPKPESHLILLSLGAWIGRDGNLHIIDETLFESHVVLQYFLRHKNSN
mgnify:CR=1 FL=1